MRRDRVLHRLIEGADYVSQRALQLESHMAEADQIVTQAQALARQLRTLASNTALEANRMNMGAPLAEIARQMRRISQRMSESNEQLALTVRSYSVANGELRRAASSLVVEARAMRQDNPMAIERSATPEPATALAKGYLPPTHTGEDG